MKRSYYIEYVSRPIRIFNDVDSCQLIFVQEWSEIKAINYDDNFYWLGELLETFYAYLLEWFGQDANDKELQKELDKYLRHLKRQGIKQEEIDDALSYAYSCHK